MRNTCQHMCCCFPIFLGIFLIISACCWGSVFYVSPDGNDSNPGTAPKPWKTISKAAATLQAGDTVYVSEGTYRERVVPRLSGGPGHPITYAAVKEGTVTLDGADVVLPDDLAGVFEINSRSWITVNGFRIVNAGPNRDSAGIMVIASSDVIIKNCITSRTVSSGIGVWAGRRVTVEGCRVDLAGSGGYQESITVAATDGFEVRGCLVSDCRKEGICLKDGSSHGKVTGNEVLGAYSVGIYVDAWDKYTHDIEVYGNRAHDNNGNGIALASEMGGLLENISVHDNLSYHNRHIGIHISTNGDTLRHPMRSISIVNNTCAVNGWDDWGGGIAHDNPDAMNVLIRNNICSANRYFQLVVIPGVPRGSAVVDHNLIDSFGATEGEVTGDAAVQGNPLFVSTAEGDFRLRLGSPAIDGGITEESAPKDFDGSPRPGAAAGETGGSSAVCDIGAYEM